MKLNNVDPLILSVGTSIETGRYGVDNTRSSGFAWVGPSTGVGAAVSRQVGSTLSSRFTTEYYSITKDDDGEIAAGGRFSASHTFLPCDYLMMTKGTLVTFALGQTLSASLSACRAIAIHRADRMDVGES